MNTIVLAEKGEPYFCTFTQRNGLDISEMELIRECLNQFECVLACHETGAGSNDHIHALVIVHKKMSNIRRQWLKDIYDYTSHESVNAPSQLLVCKKATKLPGVVAYISKQVEDGKYFVRRGYKVTWIQQQLELNLKATRYYQKWHNVSATQAPECIKMWCDVNHRSIRGKEEFANVVLLMQADGIPCQSWCRSMPWIYASVMQKFGDNSYLADHILSLLNFIK